MSEEKKLSDVLDKAAFDILCKEIMKKRRVENDDVIYELFDYKAKGATLEIKAEHVTIDEVFDYAKSSCKQCNGKGYYIINMEKRRIPNPEDYVVMAKEPINDMPEEMKKIWIEKEKKNKFWRVMLPCRCALKVAHAKDPDFLSNGEGNILVRVKYEIKEGSIE